MGQAAFSISGIPGFTDSGSIPELQLLLTLTRVTELHPGHSLTGFPMLPRMLRSIFTSQEMCQTPPVEAFPREGIIPSSTSGKVFFHAVIWSSFKEVP